MVFLQELFEKIDLKTAELDTYVQIYKQLFLGFKNI